MRWRGAAIWNVPVIGVAKSGWNLDQLRARADESIEKHGGGVDDQAFSEAHRAPGLYR